MSMSKKENVYMLILLISRVIQLRQEANLEVPFKDIKMLIIQAAILSVPSWE